MINIKKTIDEYIKNIKSNKDKLDPSIPYKIKAKDRYSIKNKIIHLRKYHRALFPYIVNLKNNIKDITEQTNICAVYLILCQTFKNWEALFLLADNEMNIPMMNILRLNKESSDLVNYISLSSIKNDNKVNKWFKGEKIQPWEIRKYISEITETEVCKNLNLKKMKGHIYDVESYYVHVTYVTLLESVNRFTKNFEFINFSTTHHTKENLYYVHGAMDGFVNSISIVYAILLKDTKKVDEINEIYKNYCDKTISAEQKNKARKKYSK